MSDASSDEAGGGGGGGFPASAATAAASGREGVLPLSLGGLAPSDRAVSAGEEESDNGMQATDDFADAADGSSFPASAATTTAAATTGGVLPLSLGGLAPSDRAVSAGEEEHDNGTQENHDFAGAADGSSFPASAAAAAAGVLPKFHYFSRGSGPSIFVGLRSLTHAPIGSSRSRHRSW